jgi:outer membrane lipoprotein LolB
MYRGKYLALSLLLLLLAACTTTDQQREPTATNWKAHKAQLAGLERWTASGKLAVRTANAAESASLVWHQQGTDTELLLSGPLGVGATSIHSDGQQLDIRRGDEHRTLDISSPDAIVLNTGWDLPLRALTHWLKGLPSPESSVQELKLNPQTGLLQTLRQDDWEIRYEKYGQFQGFTLPTRLQIKRDASAAKVVIAQWLTTPN